MINKWILNNFKSINEEKELEFRPLTIFTGANSSGKSTILQSILLVTQTLQNQVSSKSIVLNGWFKKFGSYSDVVFARDIEKNIKIGFSFTSEEDEEDMYWRRAQMRRMAGRMVIPPPSFSSKRVTNCEFAVSSAGVQNNLQPEMEYVKIAVNSDDVEIDSTEVKKWNKRNEIEEKVYQALAKKNYSSDLNYTIKGNLRLSRRFYDEDTLWKPIGVRFNHFLPEMMIAYCSNADQVKVILRDYLLMGSPYYYEIEDYEKQIVPLIQKKAMEIVEQLYSKGLSKKNIDKTYDSIKKKFTLKKLQKMLSACALDEEKHRYVSQIIDKLDDLPEEYRIEPKPLNHQIGVEDIRDYFRSRINYLGPLREEPKSLYPLGNEGSKTEVGLKGENTAAVLYNNRDELITYISPNAFTHVTNMKLHETRGTLTEAVTQWLQYMEVANAVVTGDQGKIGHTMQISNDLDKNQDLTNVGVGVSQVLPILVMSLMAKKGDVIILEQPELHLHPKVQTRLADFFVAMNALGKQCIVETHSEYMINRLRYLVAINDSSKVADDTMIYFVEKHNGHSEYRPVTINKYGVIEDWPDGFFDESEKIAAEILRAGMEKHLQEEGDEEDDE